MSEKNTKQAAKIQCRIFFNFVLSHFGVFLGKGKGEYDTPPTKNTRN
jgi:hypothetical protein